MKRNCDYKPCGKEYEADERNLKRGWGLCCSKSCAAHKREESKLTYSSERVKQNNIRRENWNNNFYKNGSSYGNGWLYKDIGNYDPGDSEYWDSKDF
jgi:hypothetical protein